MLTFSQKPKSEKQTIFLVGAIKQKCICHFINCLLDLFYLGIQKCLMLEVFTSSSIIARQVNKRNFWDLYMYIYYTFLSNYKMIIQDMFPFVIVSCLIQHVLSSENSINYFITFVLQNVKKVFPEYNLALQFGYLMANFVPLLRGQPH